MQVYPITYELVVSNNTNYLLSQQVSNFKTTQKLKTPTETKLINKQKTQVPKLETWSVTGIIVHSEEILALLGQKPHAANKIKKKKKMNLTS